MPQENPEEEGIQSDKATFSWAAQYRVQEVVRMAADDDSAAVAKTKPQPTILISGTDLSPEILLSILEEARTIGWRVLDLVLTRGAVPPQFRPVGALISRPLDHPDSKWARQLSCPVVRIGFREHPLDHEAPAVCLDLTAIGRLAAEHFAERNFKHVGFVGHKPLIDFMDMYEGFRQRAEELGCFCHFLALSIDRKTGPLYETRTKQLSTWLSELPKPIGLFTYADARAVMLAHMCVTAHLVVPDEVALLGRGNSIAKCEMGPVELSSVDTNQLARGRKAVQLLHQLVIGKDIAENLVTVSPIGVVERQSTNLLAVPEPAVAKALRYMWDHLDAPLSVGMVAKHVGVSRRRLERQFKKHLDRGVKQELVRKRLELACELLATGELTVESVADRSGFGTALNLRRSFRKAFGISPSQYRPSP